MKNSLILLLLLLCQTAHSQNFFNTSNSDCEYFEKITAWEPSNQGDTTCAHRWVYAEHYDVNPPDYPGGVISLAVLTPCPNGNTENEARVCEQCLRHEKRQKSWGYHVVQKKSPYQVLADKLKPPGDPILQFDTTQLGIRPIQGARYFIRQ